MSDTESYKIVKLSWDEAVEAEMALRQRMEILDRRMNNSVSKPDYHAHQAEFEQAKSAMHKIISATLVKP